MECIKLRVTDMYIRKRKDKSCQMQQAQKTMVVDLEKRIEN